MIAGLPPYPEYKQSVAGTDSDAQGNSRIKTVLRKLDYRSTEGLGAKGDFNSNPCYYKSLACWKLKKPRLSAIDWPRTT